MDSARLTFLRSVFLLLLCVLAVNLFFCQVINGQYYLTLSEQNRIRLIPLPALRGQVLDSAGRVLTGNRPSYDVSIVYQDFDRNQIDLLAKILNLRKSDIKSVVDKAKASPFSPVLLEADAGMEEIFQLEELNPEIKGVYMDIHGRRNYPWREAAGHITGYIGLISRKEYENGDRVRFLFSDYIGRSGIEKAFDEHLRGYHGGRQIEVNSRGQVLKTMSERRPTKGHDIYLTIDAELQSALYELIKDKRAVVGIMDLKKDAVLALVTAPSFDPNAFVMPSRAGERVGYLSSSGKPMVNQAIQGGFPLGSIFKLVVALGALEEKIITPGTTFHCDGTFTLKPGQRPFKCWNPAGHGTMNLNQAVMQSCNIFFYECGKRLGVERIASYARQLGLGSTWDLELGTMFPGIVPDQQWKLDRIGDRWYQGETISLAIGQSYLLVSPLQILRLVATIANDGRVAEPHMVDYERSGLHETARKKNMAHINAAHFRELKAAMREAIESSRGTGRLARMEGLSVAGKTSTAQAPTGEGHSWFAGFAPFEAPEVAIVAFIEHGGSGGLAAAPLAREALEIWQSQKNARVTNSAELSA
ncbi:MAG: penicillin-binding protein 2 [Candidatus Omnitrophica bacterium]|nr:penicillin-binding protein 2 [Candidatus Omnitrophota bacterium]